MKVKIQGDMCTGHGRCYSMAPSIYVPDDEGYNGGRDTVIDIAPGDEELARRSVHSCPEGAISLMEE